MLVQRGGRGRNDWLLLYKHDDHAREGWNPEDHPYSVKTGRTNDEVAEAPQATEPGGPHTSPDFTRAAHDP